MAPLTPCDVDFDCASRSDPLSGDDVTPCNLPVEPLSDAAGVGLFFLSLNKKVLKTVVIIVNLRIEVFSDFFSPLEVLFAFRKNFFFHFFTFGFI